MRCVTEFQSQSAKALSEWWYPQVVCQLYYRQAPSGRYWQLHTLMNSWWNILTIVTRTWNRLCSAHTIIMPKIHISTQLHVFDYSFVWHVTIRLHKIGIRFSLFCNPCACMEPAVSIHYSLMPVMCFVLPCTITKELLVERTERHIYTVHLHYVM